MKKLLFGIALLGLLSNSFAITQQESEVEKLKEELKSEKKETKEHKALLTINEDSDKSEVSLGKTLRVYEDYDRTDVSIGNNTIMVSEQEDTTTVKIGKRGLRIVEDENGTDVNILDMDDFEDEFEYRRVRQFKGHWAGFELGINGYVDKDYNFTLTNDLAPYELNYTKSYNVNINFLQYNLGLISDKIGLVTGMGFEFNDYKFDRKITIIEDDAEGITRFDDQTYAGYNVQKTKLSTTYLTVPLILEFQVPVYRYHRLYLGGGVIGGVNIGAHTKVVYEDGGKQKDKVKDDFNLSPFRYAATVRVGYRSLRLFANYNLVSLFEKNKGPELYPFSIGLVLIDF